jgi:TM2 domain-containing membrane protein YozV
MDQQRLFAMLPGLQPEELVSIQHYTKDLTEEQQQQFIVFYQGRRKDAQTILIMTVIGFFAVAGIQRFVLGQIGMGLLYFFTAGLCGIGTIIDLVNNKKLTWEYNQKQMLETAQAVQMMSR